MASVITYRTVAFPPSLQGYVARGGVNEAFSTIRAGSGNASSIFDQYIQLTSSTTTNQYSFLTRAILLFDTSSIPVGSTITAATVYMASNFYSTGLGSDSVVVVSSNPASNSGLSNSDYGTLGSTSFGSVAQNTFASDVWFPITLNGSGLSGITAGGITKLGLRTNWDTTGTPPTWVSNTNTTMSFKSVGLTVEYNFSSPTLSVTNLPSISNITSVATS